MKDNVGVLKGEGAIVFRSLELFSGPDNFYRELVYYLQKLVEDYHGVVALPLDLLRYWNDLSAPCVLPRTILYHASTMPMDTFADFCFEIHRILTKQMNYWGDFCYNAIYDNIGKANKAAVLIILSHGVLVQFMPEYARVTYPPENYPFIVGYYQATPPINAQTAKNLHDVPKFDAGIGQFLVVTMRHAAVHSVESDVAIVAWNNMNFRGTVTRPAVLRAGRAQFPNYVADAMAAFSAEKKLALLGIKDRFPLLKLHTTPVASEAKIVGEKLKALSDVEKDAYVSVAEKVKAEYSKKMEVLDAEYDKKEELDAQYTQKMEAYNNKQSGGPTACGESD